MLQVPSETAFLALVRDVTKKMAEVAGFDAAAAAQVALAVDEAATNVIEHAYTARRDRASSCASRTRGDELRVEVVDDGAHGRPARAARAWTSSATRASAARAAWACT